MHTPTASPSRLQTFALGAWFSFVLLTLGAYALHNARVFHPWNIGEWLINYHGGFIRRGLSGEVLLAFAKLTHIPLPYVVALLQLLLLLLVCIAVMQMARRFRMGPAYWMLIASPATFAFQVLDPPTVLRKELLLYASLATLVLVLLRSRVEQGRWIAALLALCVAVCALSHEPLLMFAPYLLAAVFLWEPSVRRACLLCLPAVLVGGLCGAAVAAHPGTSQQAAAVCHAIGGNLQGYNEGRCGGAIKYLGVDAASAASQVAAAEMNHNYFSLYGICLVLAAVPFVLVLRRLQGDLDHVGKHRELYVLLAFTAISGVASIPVFLLGADWGRWISIHAMCLMLLCCYVQAQAAAVETEASIKVNPFPAWMMWLVVAVYCTCWTLPAIGAYQGRYGYIDLYHYFRGYGGRPHPRADG